MQVLAYWSVTARTIQTIAGSILQSLREINQTLEENPMTVHFDKESEGGEETNTAVVRFIVHKFGK